MPETVNRNHLYASAICRIQMFWSLNTRILCIKKKKALKKTGLDLWNTDIKQISFWLVFKVSGYKTVNSRGYKRENLVFVTVSKIYYRNGGLRKRRERSVKEQQMTKKNSNMLHYEHCKEFLEFRLLPSFQIAWVSSPALLQETSKMERIRELLDTESASAWQTTANSILY